jgi:branched-chain amino acid transport system ATP-binding protein
VREPVLRERRGLVPTPRQVDVGDLPPRLGRQDAPSPRALSSRREKRRGWKQGLREWGTIGGPALPLTVFSLITLSARAEDAALGVLLPQIRAEFGINLQFVVALGSLVTVVGLLFAPVLGWLADRIRRVLMIRFAAIASALGGVLQGLAPGVTQFAGGRVVSGGSLAVAQPASFPLMTDYYPSHSRARVFSIYFVAAQTGSVIGPPVAGVLGDAFGWRAAVVGFGLVAAAAALLAFLVKEPRRGAHDIVPAAAPDQQQQQQQQQEEEAPSESERVSFGEAYRAARSVVTLRRIWYATPFLAVTGLFNLVILPSYFAEVFQLSSSRLGLLIAAFNLSALLGLLVAGPISERLLAERPARIMSLGGALTAVQAVLLVGLSLAGNQLLALAATLPIAFLSTVLLPGFYSVISLVVPPRIRGLGLQTTAPWQVLGLVFVPFVLDWSVALGVRRGILVFVPLLLIGGAIFATGAGGVERDIRAARAAAVADEENRRRRAEGATPLLVIRDLEVAYDGVVVVRGVDLDVDEGEIVALLGTNGAGKSTILRAIAGTQEASAGAVLFDGRDVTHAPPHENAGRGVVVMPGGAATFPDLTVADNLRAAAWSAQAEDRIAEALDLFPELRDRVDTPAASLSGGEQQMVGLAQAFIQQPKLLLIDELSLGLAPAVVERLLKTIAQMADQGTSVVLVEQSLNVALTVAERAVFLESGEIRYDGPTAELLARPELVRAVFLGRQPGRGRRSTISAPPRLRPEDDAPPAMTVDRLSVHFGGVAAVSDVSIRIEPGEVLGIIGPNGAGKTTLFDAISGFVPTTEGQVHVGGVDVTTATPDARARLGLGRSFQSARLFPSLTVRETIATALERRAVRNPALTALGLPAVRRSERLLARRVENLVDLLGLDAYADAFVGELSTGTRRAVDLACVLASEPRVLLLDEPSSGLAQAEIEELGPTLKGVARQTGCAMLLIEHDLPLVTSVSSRLLALELGAMVVEGPPEDVCNDPRVVAAYLAASRDVLARSGERGAAIAAALSQERGG